jgi:hypothetical protein
MIYATVLDHHDTDVDDKAEACRRLVAATPSEMKQKMHVYWKGLCDAAYLALRQGAKREALGLFDEELQLLQADDYTDTGSIAWYPAANSDTALGELSVTPDCGVDALKLLTTAATGPSATVRYHALRQLSDLAIARGEWRESADFELKAAYQLYMDFRTKLNGGFSGKFAQQFERLQELVSPATMLRLRATYARPSQAALSAW